MKKHELHLISRSGASEVVEHVIAQQLGRRKRERLIAVMSEL